MNAMPTLTLPAPAKLNLFLHVTGRRADGYHSLQTVFQLLDHGDTLHFETRNDADIELTPELPGVASADNLIVRAARALQAHTGCSLGARIHLEKRLPLGGGIGGGSSDAATTLLGLNHLWNLRLSIDELAMLGVRLGADVPVFVRGRSAFAEGIGERLQPVQLPESNYLILVPPCQVSTAQIFSEKTLTRNTSPITIAAFLEGGTPQENAYGHGGQLVRNDCEPVVRRLYPAVAHALDWLSQFEPARLTGTGACVFASFARRGDAEELLNRLPAGCKGFVARGVNVSPAHSALGFASAD